MIRLTKNLWVAASALAFMMITSCGGGGDAEADKVAAAYYEEQFNNEDNVFGQKSYGDLEKWETMAQLQISVAYFCSIGLYFLV